MKLLRDQIVDGKYRILQTLGEGSMGAVYLAENMRIARQVALKVLHADLEADEGRGASTRFQTEAQITARVGSAHIVEVFDMGELPDGNCYLVMEYLEGETLGARLESRGKLDADETTGLALQMLDGLARAHHAHVVHRDIKPENIYLVRREGGDFVKILDFGVSKLVEDAQRRAPHLTMDGTVVGTPQYMSPEQARGKELDARSDLYSVGVVLYECLSGAPPFGGTNVQDVLFRVALEDPPALDAEALGLDPELVAIVERAMARDVDARFASAEAFREALRAYREQRGFARVLESGRPGPLLSLASSAPSTPPSSIAVTVDPPTLAVAAGRGPTSTTTATAVSTAEASSRRDALREGAASTMLSASPFAPRPAVWPRALAAASLGFALLAGLWSYESASVTPSADRPTPVAPVAQTNDVRSAPTTGNAEDGATTEPTATARAAETTAEATRRAASRPVTAPLAVSAAKAVLPVASASAKPAPLVAAAATSAAPASPVVVPSVPSPEAAPSAAPSLTQTAAEAAPHELPVAEVVGTPPAARPAADKPSAKTIRGRKYRADL